MILVDTNAVSDFWRRVPQVMAHFDNPPTVYVIPDHDAWIAATALQYDLPVLSRDKHLTYVNEIKVISWPTPST